MTLERSPGEYLRFPTPEEMLALERAARRARAEAIGRLFAAAARPLKEMIMKVPRTDPAPREGSRFPTKRKTMTTSFWKDALASLPPSVHRGYAADFEAAERFEWLPDLGVEAGGFARHPLAKICQAGAHPMRGRAGVLDGAAHRLFLRPLAR